MVVDDYGRRHTLPQAFRQTPILCCAGQFSKAGANYVRAPWSSWQYYRMSGKQDRDAWMREIQERQRNVVFPDTVENERRMWRALLDYPLNWVQVVGLILIAVTLLSAMCSYVYIHIWASRQGGERLLSILLRYSSDKVVVVLIIGGFIYVMGRSLNHRHHKRR